jgi:hypothetical protein
LFGKVLSLVTSSGLKDVFRVNEITTTSSPLKPQGPPLTEKLATFSAIEPGAPLETVVVVFVVGVAWGTLVGDDVTPVEGVAPGELAGDVVFTGVGVGDLTVVGVATVLVLTEALPDASTTVPSMLKVGAAVGDGVGLALTPSSLPLHAAPARAMTVIAMISFFIKWLIPTTGSFKQGTLRRGNEALQRITRWLSPNCYSSGLSLGSRSF